MSTQLRALGFVRISRDTEGSTSLIKQREAIENYAKALGWTLVHVAESSSVSGNTAPKDHESLREWLTDTPPEPWDILLSNTLDRVSRNTRDTLDLVAWLDQRDKSVQTIQDHVDSGSGHGKLMLIILSAVAEAERTFTAERLAATRVRLRREGWHQQGTAPYGYRAEQSDRTDTPGKRGWKWVIDPDARAVLVRAIDRAIEGISVSQICDELNADKVPTPTRGTRQGDRWHPASLFRMLKGEQLLGHGYHRGRVIHELGRPISFGPPLIDRALFDRLQLALSDNGKPHAKNHATSLLYGMVSCAECGQRMVGSGTGARESYVCRNKKCRNGAVLRRVVDEAVDQDVRYHLQGLQYLSGRWTTGQTTAGLQAELSELKAASKRLIEDRQAGVYDDPELVEVFRSEQTRNNARMKEVRGLIEASPDEAKKVFEPSGEPLVNWLDLWDETEDVNERRNLLLTTKTEVLVGPPTESRDPQDRVEVISRRLSSVFGRTLDEISDQDSPEYALTGFRVVEGPITAFGALVFNLSAWPSGPGIGPESSREEVTAFWDSLKDS